MHSYTHASINTHIHTLTHTHLLTLTHTRIRLYNVQLHGKILIRRWNNDVNLFWCCLSLSLLLTAVVVVVVVFHKHCRHVIAASIAVVVVVAKWGRVRVDFCTLHFKYEHIFVQCTKRGKTKGTKARNDPQLWLQRQLQLQRELQQESQAAGSKHGQHAAFVARAGVKYFYKPEGGGRARREKVEERRKERVKEGEVRQTGEEEHHNVQKCKTISRRKVANNTRSLELATPDSRFSIANWQLATVASRWFTVQLGLCT